MSKDDELHLTSRPGLPESIAYLREKYPSSEWRKHPNYGSLTDFWLHMHAQLRREGADVQRLLLAFQVDEITPDDFQRRFATTLGTHLNHLNGHHQIEDQFYFPRFRALDTRMKIGFDLLERDHAVIHHQLEQSATRANVLLHSLQQDRAAQLAAGEKYAGHALRLLTLLDRHLDDEEDLVVPGMLEHGEREFH